MILLDTSVLSAIFRRKSLAAVENAEAAAFRRMIRENTPVSTPGIAVQEVLSGVRTPEQAARLREELEGLPFVFATRREHYLAADIFNQCQTQGIAAATVDCLIAATAIAHRAKLWTLDQDFPLIGRVCDLEIFQL